jgi:hypothetical protein
MFIVKISTICIDYQAIMLIILFTQRITRHMQIKDDIVDIWLTVNH